MSQKRLFKEIPTLTVFRAMFYGEVYIKTNDRGALELTSPKKHYVKFNDNTVVYEGNFERYESQYRFVEREEEIKVKDLKVGTQFKVGSDKMVVFMRRDYKIGYINLNNGIEIPEECIESFKELKAEIN